MNTIFKHRKVRYVLTRLFLAFQLFLLTQANADNAPAYYSPTLIENFDGNSLNTNLWDYRNLGVRCSAYNTKAAVSVSNNNLNITTYTSSGTNCTGMISTENSFLQTYGYFEATISCSMAQGVGSAFWLQSPTINNIIGNWSTGGVEIDVMENYYNTSDFSMHWDGYGVMENSQGPTFNYPLSPTQIHTLGFLWTHTGYRFYIDGQLKGSYIKGISHCPEYVILSSEMNNSVRFGTVSPTGYGILGSSSNQVTSFGYVHVYAPPQPIAVLLEDDFDDGPTGSPASFDTWSKLGSSSTASSITTGSDWELHCGQALQISTGSTTGAQASKIFSTGTLNPNQRLELTFNFHYTNPPANNSTGFQIALGNASGTNASGLVIQVPTGSSNSSARFLTQTSTNGHLGYGGQKTLLGGSSTQFCISGTTLHCAELDITCNSITNGNPNYSLFVQLDGTNYTCSLNNISPSAVSNLFNTIAIGNNTATENLNIDNIYLQIVPTSPPVGITGSATNIGYTQATLNGSVNPGGLGSTFSYQYGTSSTYDHITSSTAIGSGTLPVSCPMDINNLQPGTLYHYQIVTSNSSATTYGLDQTFTTLNLPPNATSGSATNISDNYAIVTGTVNPNGLTTTYFFNFGTDNNVYGSTTGTFSAGSDSNDHLTSGTLTGLSPSTTYHYQLVASSSAGTTFGLDQSITTNAQQPPLVVTGSHVGTTYNSSTIMGSVNPNGQTTTYFFQYGLTPTSFEYSTPPQSAGSGRSLLNYSVTLTELPSSTAYYYRIVAVNASGTSYGATWNSGTTIKPATSPTLATGTATSTKYNSSMLTGALNPNGLATNYWFEYGATTSYGSTTGTFSAGNGTKSTLFGAPITNLNPSTTYHFRIIGSNASGTIYGTDQILSTTAALNFSSITPAISTSGNDIIITIQSVLNYNYQLQRTQKLSAPTTWLNLAPPQAGSGSALLFTDPGIISGTGSFYYHIQISQ